MPIQKGVERVPGIQVLYEAFLRMSSQLNMFDLGAKRNDAPANKPITNKVVFRQVVTIDNLSHNMLIHGYLRAVHDYIFDFGLENTAAYIMKTSGILKEDFIRCQLETEWNNEKMLAIIDRAFSINTEDQETPEMSSDNLEVRVKALTKRAFEKKAYDRNYIPKVRFNYEYFKEQINKRKQKRNI